MPMMEQIVGNVVPGLSGPGGPENAILRDNLVIKDLKSQLRLHLLTSHLAHIVQDAAST